MSMFGLMGCRNPLDERSANCGDLRRSPYYFSLMRRVWVPQHQNVDSVRPVSPEILLVSPNLCSSFTWLPTPLSICLIFFLPDSFCHAWYGDSVCFHTTVNDQTVAVSAYASLGSFRPSPLQSLALPPFSSLCFVVLPFPTLSDLNSTALRCASP